MLKNPFYKYSNHYYNFYNPFNNKHLNNYYTYNLSNDHYSLLKNPKSILEPKPNNIHNPLNNTPKKSNSKPNINPFLEIFDLKLYFDDILIISILFFLYIEGVQDFGLFIVLILLLIT